MLFRTICFFLYTFLLGFSASAANFFSENDQYIVAVQLSDGTSLSESVDVYRTQGQWYLPLTLFSEILGFGITVSPTLGGADGFYISEERKFKLTTRNCEVEYSGQKETYPCDLVRVYDEEIYIESELFAKWFFIDVSADSFSSKITLKPKLKIPIQLRLERARSPLQQLGTATDEDQKNIMRPTGPSAQTWVFDQQIGWFDRNHQVEKSQGFTYGGTLVTDIGGFESKVFGVTGSGQEQAFEVNFSKKDFQGNIWGFSSLKKVELFDFRSASVPLVSSSVLGRGMLLSSFPLQRDSSFGTKTFRGPLLNGWTVELYQNDLLINRGAGDANSEYRFEDVVLYYGLNRFKLIFYGPQGQIKEESENIIIGANQVKAGEFNYLASAFQEKDLTQRQHLKLEYGFADKLSGALSFYDSQDLNGKGRQTYSLLGMNTGVGPFLGGLTLASQAGAGTASDISLQTSFQSLSLTLNRADYSNYRRIDDLEDPVGLKSSQAINFASSLGAFLPMSISAGLTQNLFEDGVRQSLLVQRISWQFKQLYFFNTLNQDLERTQKDQGEFSILYRKGLVMWKTLLAYEDNLRELALEAQTNISDRFSLQGRVIKSYWQDSEGMSLGLTHERDELRITGSLDFDTLGNYAFAGGLSFSAFWDRERGYASVRSGPIGDYGLIQARVFLDKNNNEIFDEGDSLLSGVGFFINNNLVPEVTDQAGAAYIVRLSPDMIGNIRLDATTFENPFSYRSNKGVHFVVNPGKTLRVDFPVSIRGDIEGMVTYEKSGRIRGARGVQVEVLNSQGEVVGSVVCESDGYFYFESLNVGSYRLRLNPESLQRLGFEVLSEEIKVDIDEAGLTEGNLDFSLKRLSD